MGTVNEHGVQPGRCPRRLHQLVLEALIGVDALDQGVSEDVALGVRAGRPVRVEERHLTRRVRNLFPVNDKRLDVNFPLRLSRTRDVAGARAGVAAAGAPDRPRLRVAHAPRLDGDDGPFVVGAAGLAGYMF